MLFCFLVSVGFGGFIFFHFGLVLILVVFCFFFFKFWLAWFLGFWVFETEFCLYLPLAALELDM